MKTKFKNILKALGETIGICIGIVLIYMALAVFATLIGVLFECVPILLISLCFIILWRYVYIHNYKSEINCKVEEKE